MRGLGKRDEQVDTRAMLLRGYDASFANGTSPRQRDDELRRVLAYWPTDLLDIACSERMVAPPWRLLIEPIQFRAEPSEVHQFVRTYLASRNRWPSIDGINRQFGRVGNHRSVSEQQGALL